MTGIYSVANASRKGAYWACLVAVALAASAGLAMQDVHGAGDVDARFITFANSSDTLSGTEYYTAGGACFTLTSDGPRVPTRVKISYIHEALGNVDSIDHTIPGKYAVEYECRGEEHGLVRQYQTISVTTDKPVIVPTRGDTANAIVGKPYVDPGAICVSNDDSRNVLGTGLVDTRTVGTHIITYDCTLGEVAADSVTRTVTVKETDDPPVIQFPDGGTIIFVREYSGENGEVPLCVDDIDGNIVEDDTMKLDRPGFGPRNGGTESFPVVCIDSSGQTTQISVTYEFLREPSLPSQYYDSAPAPPSDCHDHVPLRIQSWADGPKHLYVTANLVGVPSVEFISHFIAKGPNGSVDIYLYDINRDKIVDPRNGFVEADTIQSATFVVPAAAGIASDYTTADIEISAVVTSVELDGGLFARGINQTISVAQYMGPFGSSSQSEHTVLDLSGTPIVLDYNGGFPKTIQDPPFATTQCVQASGMSIPADRVDTDPPIPTFTSRIPGLAEQWPDPSVTFPIPKDAASLAAINAKIECYDNVDFDKTSMQNGIAAINTALAANPDTEGKYEYSGTCTDAAGNSARKNFTLTIDTTKPTIAAPDVAAPSVQFGTVFEIPDLECTDNIDDTRPAVIGGEADRINYFKTGEYALRYTCTDAAGNRGAAQTIVLSVVDTTSPEINLEGPSEVFWPVGQDWNATVFGATCTDPETLPDDLVWNMGVANFTRADDVGRYAVNYTCSHPGAPSVTELRLVNLIDGMDRPYIDLEDTYVIRIDVNTPYIEQDALCIDDVFPTVNATISGDTVDNSTAGIYKVDYDCTFPGMEDARSASRIVLVGDTTGTIPKITLTGADAVLQQQGMEYEDKGAVCGDGSTVVIGGDTVLPETPQNYTVQYFCSMMGQFNNTERIVAVSDVPKVILADTASDDENTLEITLGEEFPGEAVTCRYDNGTAADVVVSSTTYMDEVTKRGEEYMADVQCVGIHNILSDKQAIRISVSLIPGGSDDDWRLNPTFGRSWDSGVRVVDGGFSFNGRSFDVTDNYHVDFERTTSVIGQPNTVTVKAFTETILDTVTLSLGVPELSRVTDSEADIHVKLRPNYQIDAEYEIVEIIHEQEEELINPAETEVSIEKMACNSSTEAACHELTIAFTIMAPLKSDVLAIAAMDQERRITTTYINDGVEFAGESLLPAETATLHFKKGNQHPVETVRLTQEDRRYNAWSDQHGYAWLQNEYGSWFQLTQAGFERLQDPAVSVMTRTHSGFEQMVMAEREKAKSVFDAEDLRSYVGESFSHDAPVRIDKLSDPVVLEKLRIAELRALEYLGR